MSISKNDAHILNLYVFAEKVIMFTSVSLSLGLSRLLQQKYGGKQSRNYHGKLPTYRGNQSIANKKLRIFVLSLPSKEECRNKTFQCNWCIQLLGCALFYCSSWGGHKNC